MEASIDVTVSIAPRELGKKLSPNEILSTRLRNKGAKKKIPSLAGFLPGFSYILRHSKQLLSTCISAFGPERN